MNFVHKNPKQKRMLHFRWIAAGLAGLLIAASLACNLGTAGQSLPDTTQTAFSQSVLGTVTAAALENQESESGELATAQAEATDENLRVAATQTAVGAASDEGAQATTTVAAPVIAELPRYEVDPKKGSLGFVHDPVKVVIEGYHEFAFANDHMQVVGRDFVLAADITWDTQYGASGCGFMFRSNGDKAKPDQYMLLATRIGNGHVIFTALADGQLANVQDFYAGYLDNSFAAENGSTNRLVVVGRGHIFEIYTNGLKIGTVDASQPPVLPSLPKAPKLPADLGDQVAVAKYQNQLKEYQDMVAQVQSNYQTAVKNFKTMEAIFDEGFVAMIAASESGKTICKFDNAWLWLIEE